MTQSNKKLEEQQDKERYEVIKKVVEIESKHHKNEVSLRLLRYCGMMDQRPAIEKFIKERGGKLVGENPNWSFVNEELEDAIDLYRENLNTDKARLCRTFVWFICYPTVLRTFMGLYRGFWENTVFRCDLKSGEQSFAGIAYKHFCDVLQRHLVYLTAKKSDGRRGAFMYVFRQRLIGNVAEEFMKTEFGSAYCPLPRSLLVYLRARESFYWEAGHEPTVSEIAAYTGISVEDAGKKERALDIRTHMIYLDTDKAGKGDIYDKCLFMGKMQESLVYREDFDIVEVRQLLRMYLAGEHLQIIEYRHGINEENRAYSLNGIAEMMGISRYFVKKRLDEAYEILRPHLIQLYAKEG